MENKGIQISVFDYSVEKFLAPFFGDNSSIGELELDNEETERFSSMITFLREWKHFKYEPRNISFFHQSKDFHDNYQIVLPQFSSASVPEVEQLAGEAKNPSSDFVLYAGGNIWALDWCARLDNKPDSSITYEYLAVSAHPPGANYHKIGAPLTGRGAIQIWSIITKTEKFESSKPKKITKKSKPKKDLVVRNPNDSNVEINEVEESTVSKPRGRPRKFPINENELKKSPKKKGRPRKRPLDDEGLCVNTPKKRGRSEKCVPINFEMPLSVDSSETLLALPPPEPIYVKITKTGTKVQNSQSNEKRQKRNVKSIYLRNSDEELITSTSTGVENYENTLAIINTLDIALPLSLLYNNKKTSKKKNKEKLKPRKNQDSRPVSCLTTTASCEKEELTGQQSSKEELTGQQSSKEELISQQSSKEELTSQQSLKEEILPMPSLVFCLAHNGKVAWDIKWKPISENNMNNTNNVNNTKRMGYLAALLGNGSLEVWDVPNANLVQKLYASNKIEGTDPRFIKLKSVFRCSKLKCGERQSIPLTLEWSTSPPHDFILAGCHDGTVAIWKFSVQVPSQDSKPLLFFTADSVPIRSLCWAPYESDVAAEISNLFVTAGSEGLKFWDIRDPYRPLWELIPPEKKSVMSVDWLKNPRCVLITLDDGRVAFLSIPKAANDLPVTGTSFTGKKDQCLFTYSLSLFNIWSIQVSRATGCAAFCVADGSAVRFQLNERFLENDPGRNRAPYFMCGLFKEDKNKRVIKISINDENNSLLEHLPLKALKGPNRFKGGDENDDSFPSKLVAVNKVRWNVNKGCERWLCYGGAAGIIRVQKILSL